MPDGGFHVHPEELEKHEQELRLRLSKMPKATDELTDSWDVEVFGVIGVLLATKFNEWNVEAAKFAGMTKAAGDHLADNLGQMRAQYVGTDGDMAGVFDSIVETLDSRLPGMQEGEQ